MPYVTVGRENSHDINIYYKDWGEGQPVVFSHGWPLSADDWDAQMMFFLGRGHRVIAHDRRGTEKPKVNGPRYVTRRETLQPRRARRPLAARQPGLDRGEDDTRVEAGARRARVDAVRPEQRGTGRDGLVPVSELSVLAMPGGDGERRVDSVLPGLRAERADQHELAARPDGSLQLLELAGGDAAVRAEADHDDVTESAFVGQAPDQRQPGRHLPVDLGVDVDTGQGRLERCRRGEHDRIADRRHLSTGDP